MNTKYDRPIRIVAHALLILASALCLYPFLLLIMASFTEEGALVRDGYSLFPKAFSLEAYRYLYAQIQTLMNAYGITLFITAAGTAVGLLITAMLAYALSQQQLPGKRLLSLMVLFSMLFNGGLVATYLWYVSFLHIKNTIYALLIPGLLTNGFLILIATNYFRTNVPASVVEAARIDGAGEFKIFFTVVIPFSTPILAAIGLMQGIAYWNDWRNGLYYITDTHLFSMQNLLNRMLQEISFLSTSDLGGYASETVVNLPTASVRMAIAVVAAIPILLIYPFFQKYFARGLTIGAVKG